MVQVDLCGGNLMDEVCMIGIINLQEQKFKSISQSRIFDASLPLPSCSHPGYRCRHVRVMKKVRILTRGTRSLWQEIIFKEN